MPRIPGRATPEGTARYAARFGSVAAEGHFRKTAQGLLFSSIGLGSYLGEPDDATDRAYTATAGEALRGGINLLDAAINYRHMRSERALGGALAQEVEAGRVRRDEIVIATKGGFIAFDGAVPPDPRGWFTKHYLAPRILAREDVVAQCHAMNPEFLRDQLGRSLVNLGVETIDVFYLHNPETQRAEVGPEEFARRLHAAFGFLEQQVAAGRIAAYGLATWRGFIVAREQIDYLSLEEVLRIAGEAGGGRHHFRVIQLPMNLAMPEALTLDNQGLAGKGRSLLAAARDSGLAVVSSATLLQGRLARAVPREFRERLPGLSTDAQRAIQFARSSPGVTTALIGMKSLEHLRENLGVLPVPPLDAEEFCGRFGDDDRQTPDGS